LESSSKHREIEVLSHFVRAALPCPKKHRLDQDSPEWEIAVSCQLTLTESALTLFDTDADFSNFSLMKVLSAIAASWSRPRNIARLKRFPHFVRRLHLAATKKTYQGFPGEGNGGQLTLTDLFTLT
jgi:hypothetical protein